jgi:hypothetical protein
MELTINIKDQKYVASFLNLILKFDYIELVDVKEGVSEIPLEHKMLLDERIKDMEEGKTIFKNWDIVKRKYERKVI